MRSTLFAVTFVACLGGIAVDASAANVTIDARPLSTNQPIFISGPRSLSFSGTVTADLPAGNYTLGELSWGTAGQTVNRVAFSVAIDGTVNYDASLAGVFAGSGTTTLKANGVLVNVTSQLSSQHQTITYVNLPNQTSYAIRVLPGIYRMGYQTHSSAGYNECAFTFNVGADGQTSVATGASAYVGTGQNLLDVRGYTLNVQSSIIGYSHGVNLLTDPGVPSYSLHVLPGPTEYFVFTENGNDYPYTANAFDFSVTSDGKVTYSPTVETYVSGAGTSTLIVEGFSIRFETPLVGYNHGVAQISGQPSSTLTVSLLPGVYKYYVTNYTLAKQYGANFFIFYVSPTGTVTYDPSLTYLRGANTSTLYVDGVKLHITTPLVGYNHGINLIAGQTRTDEDVYVLPGAYSYYVTTFVGGQYLANEVDFSVGTSGAVDYAATFDGWLHGRGTSTLNVAGYLIRFDMHLAPNTTAYDVALIQGWSPKSVIGQTYLIPGKYTLEAGALSFRFDVSQSGALDYAASLDGTIYGRGTSYMTYGIPACTTNNDCAGGLVCNSGLCGADTLAPTISIVSRADYTSDATTTLVGRVTDNGRVASVQVNHATVAVAADGTFEAELSLVEGSNSIEIVAADAAGNTNALSTQTTRDSVAPEIVVLSPLSGQLIGDDGLVAVTVRITDASPTTVTIDGQPAVVPADGTVRVVASVPANGLNSIAIVATDAADNTADASATVLVDRQAPQLVSDLVDGVSRGPLPGDIVTFNLFVNDVGATTVSLSDGSSYHLPRGGGVIAVAYLLHEGDNAIRATVENEGHHVAMFSSMQRYDRSAPTLALVSPAEGSVYRGWLELSADSVDAITGVETVAFQLDGGATLAAAASGAAWTVAVDTRTLQDGTHTVRATSTDRVGNQATANATFVVDNAAPAVSLLGPNEGAYLRGTVTLVAQAQDATSGVAQLDILVNGAVVRSCASGSCSVPFDTTSVASGPLSVSAVATDRAGNVSAQAQVHAIADNDAITSFLTSPSPGAVVKTSLLVAINVRDADFASASCSVGSTALGGTTDPQFQQTVDLTSQLDGALTVSCSATDAAGNVGTESATVRVANWTEMFHPQSLRLPAKGNWVTMSVRGVNAAILVPINARNLTLRVPGGAAVAASLGRVHVAGDKTSFDTEVDECDGPSATHVDLRFNRAAFSASVKAGIAAGLINPNQPVTVTLYAGDHLIGSDSIKVKP
ncbi:MAG TPA: Ig-like domain-containing protein [Kofleriaceae bacterium]|nr:Ig-like domain-containing protein [Kofleriaceae bacterium]